MNDTINKCLLLDDKFIPEMYLRQPGFRYSKCRPFTNNKYKNLKKLVIQGIFINMKYDNHIYSMTWLMEVSKI